MVVSAHPLASQVGAEIMQQGGNAYDAAVAVHFALAVVYPSAGNIGGGGFAVFRHADGVSGALDYRETCPSGVDSLTFLDEEGQVIEGRSLNGHLAAGVPGSVAGMAALHDSLGSMPWDALIAPSIRLAREGFPLTRREADKLRAALPDIRRFSTQKPASLTRSGPRLEGDTLRLPQLAATLGRIAARGRAGFYRGKTAELLIAEMQRGGGGICHDDLREYRAIWRQPVTGNFHGYALLTMPPPSAGGIGLIQMLESVEDLPLKHWGWHDPRSLHAMTAAERWVYADRSRWIGDPAFFELPRDGLLDTAYIESRMAATYQPGQAADSDTIGPGTPPFRESDHTTHFSVVDPEGNAVAVTTTLNQPFGSRVWVAGAGFLLNNEMDDFALKPGAANRYGLGGGQANAVAPGKRMASSMCPTIVARDGQLAYVLGSPGGSTIPTTVFQVALNSMVHGMNMQEAVSAARVHHQWKPDVVLMENAAMHPAVVWGLWRRGNLTVPRMGFIGAADCIRRRADGRLEGGADPRGDDAAVGF